MDDSEPPQDIDKILPNFISPPCSAEGAQNPDSSNVSLPQNIQLYGINT